MISLSNVSNHLFTNDLHMCINQCEIVCFVFLLLYIQISCFRCGLYLFVVSKNLKTLNFPCGWMYSPNMIIETYTETLLTSVNHGTKLHRWTVWRSLSDLSICFLASIHLNVDTFWRNVATFLDLGNNMY